MFCYLYTYIYNLLACVCNLINICNVVSAGQRGCYYKTARETRALPYFFVVEEEREIFGVECKLSVVLSFYVNTFLMKYESF